MPKQRPLSQLFRDLIEAERDQMAQCAAGSASGYEEAQKRRERLRIEFGETLEAALNTIGSVGSDAAVYIM